MKKVEEIVNRMINNGVIPMNEYDYDICNFICDNLDETFLKIYDAFLARITADEWKKILMFKNYIMTP